MTSSLAWRESTARKSANVQKSNAERFIRASLFLRFPWQPSRLAPVAHHEEGESVKHLRRALSNTHKQLFVKFMLRLGRPSEFAGHTDRWHNRILMKRWVIIVSVIILVLVGASVLGFRI